MEDIDDIIKEYDRQSWALITKSTAPVNTKSPLEKLKDMGFAENAARTALGKSKNNIQKAIKQLLNESAMNHKSIDTFMHVVIDYNNFISNLDDIKNANNNTIIFFDIDKTLLYFKKGWNADGTRLIYTDIIAIDPELPNLLNILKRKNVKIFGLTARNLEDTWRHKN